MSVYYVFLMTMSDNVWCIDYIQIEQRTKLITTERDKWASTCRKLGHYAVNLLNILAYVNETATRIDTSLICNYYVA